jgi:superoxide dismutase, Fe-Mn family
MSSNKETIGNYELAGDDVVTRREVLLMGAMAAGTLVAGAPVIAQPAIAAATAAPGDKIYVAKDFSGLLGKKNGFTDSQLSQHFKLYEGYIGKANELNNKLKEVDISNANATYAPLREMLVEESYAVNGVVFHEYYFGNLGGKGGEPTGDLRAAIEERWGSNAKFMDYLKASGKCMRGWVVIGWNLRGNHLSAFGLDMHNMWTPTHVVPIMVLDVYEHAYMIDYGIDRGKYLDAFINNLDWDVVAKRLVYAHKCSSGADSTV